MIRHIFLLFIILPCIQAWAQYDISLLNSEVMIKAKEEKVFSFDLKEGDEVILDFDMVKGKQIQEIELKQYGGSKIYTAANVEEIKSQKINILQTGKYKLYFRNNGLTNRVFHFSLKRSLSLSEIPKYYPDLEWVTVYDTLYKLIERPVLVRSDTLIYNLTDKTAKISAQWRPGQGSSCFGFTLPENTVTWSYYIGVDQAGIKAFNNAVNMLNKNMGPVLVRLPNYGPLAALALGGASFLTSLNTGEDVDYYLSNKDQESGFENKKGFKYFKKGKVINDFSAMHEPLNGSYLFCFSNDNKFRSVNVTLKIVSVSIHQVWENKTERIMVIQEKKIPKPAKN